jgi:hypothetical protein
MTYCDACGIKLEPDEQYLVTPPVNGVGTAVIECLRHLPCEHEED